MSDDEKYIMNKIPFCNNQDIYWYCVPHDCVELNSIVTGTLISLYLNKSMNEIYCISVSPENTYDRHIVICNKSLLSGDILILARNDS